MSPRRKQQQQQQQQQQQRRRRRRRKRTGFVHEPVGGVFERSWTCEDVNALATRASAYGGATQGMEEQKFMDQGTGGGGGGGGG